ncbi:MAG: FecR domain-containing protein, partial [Ruminococcus sp.]|nr:FecR domain-containing protein [Ruminococcus sp.]
MKKLQRMLSLLTALLVVTAVTTGVVFSKTAAYRVIKVFELEGTGYVSNEKNTNLKAYKGMKLENEDKVSVGEASLMRLSLDNDKFVQLDENTVIRLYASGTIFKNKTSIELLEGGILNEITEPLSEESSYEVKTANTTMSVRGTSFYVSVETAADGSFITTVQTFDGEVEVRLYNGKNDKLGKAYILTPGESVSIKTSGGKNARTYYFKDAQGGISAVASGENPVTPCKYSDLPNEVKLTLIHSHDTGLLKLEDHVIRELKRLVGLLDDESPVYNGTLNEDDSPAATTSAPEFFFPTPVSTNGFLRETDKTTFSEITTTVTTTQSSEQETTSEETTSEEVTSSETTADTSVSSEETSSEETTTEETSASVIEYTVEFVNNDGSVILSTTAEEGSSVTPPSAPEYVFGSDWNNIVTPGAAIDASKYTGFTGWSSDNTSTLTNIVADTVFTAQYDKFIPVLYTNAESGLSYTETISVGDAIPEMTQTFIDEVKTSLGITDCTTSISASHSDTSEATWSSLASTNSSITVTLSLTEQFNVVFKNNDGTVLSEQTIDVNG